MKFCSFVYKLINILYAVAIPFISQVHFNFIQADAQLLGPKIFDMVF